LLKKPQERLEHLMDVAEAAVIAAPAWYSLATNHPGAIEMEALKRLIEENRDDEQRSRRDASPGSRREPSVEL